MFATRMKDVKEFSFSIIRWQDKQFSAITLVFTCTKSKTRMKLPQSSSRIQARLSPASCCSKIALAQKDFTSTCFTNFRIKKHQMIYIQMILKETFLQRKTKGNNVFEPTSNLDQNCNMVLRH